MLRRMPRHPLRPIPRPRQPNLNPDANSPPNVPKRRMLDVESVTLESRSLKPTAEAHPAVMPNQRLAVKAAHPPRPIVRVPHVVDLRQNLGVKEIVTAHPNPVKVKTVLRCIAMAVVIAAPALAKEIVVTNPDLVTAKNILRCIATEIVTALPVREIATKEASLPIMANVVSFTRIADLVMEIAARSVDLVTATLRIVTKGHPGSILTAGIVIMDAASAPTHVSVSAHSRPVAR
jgi:hypothetical protein